MVIATTHQVKKNIFSFVSEHFNQSTFDHCIGSEVSYDSANGYFMCTPLYWAVPLLGSVLKSTSRLGKN